MMDELDQIERSLKQSIEKHGKVGSPTSNAMLVIIERLRKIEEKLDQQPKPPRSD
jgi:hypothetical protein